MSSHLIKVRVLEKGIWKSLHAELAGAVTMIKFMKPSQWEENMFYATVQWNRVRTCRLPPGGWTSCEKAVVEYICSWVSWLPRHSFWFRLVKWWHLMHKVRTPEQDCFLCSNYVSGLWLMLCLCKSAFGWPGICFKDVSATVRINHDTDTNRKTIV